MTVQDLALLSCSDLGEDAEETLTLTGEGLPVFL